MNFIQEWRLVQAMAETSLQFTITEEKLNALKYLKRFHPVSLRCGTGLPIPGDIIGIDHDRPVTRIGNIYRTLIYPHHILDYCKKLWQDNRPIRFGFLGLAHTTRDMTLRTWYDRFGSRMPSILPEHWEREMASNHDRSFHRAASGTCAIIYSDKGRNFPVKVWDDDYYRCLSKTEFVLCPDGEKIWSYRFFEAIMCGAIPIVQTKCSTYDGFSFYTMDDASSELQYKREVAESNFHLCHTKLTVPLDALDATLTALVAELGRGTQPKARESLGGQRPDLSKGAAVANVASEQDVIMAYKLILGREPESSAAVQNIVGKKISFTGMRDIFIGSTEFRRNVMETVGGMLKPLDWNANSIETEVDSDTLELLYTHIEQVWSNLGDTEPHYSVLTDQKFKSVSFRQHAEEFYASGSRSLRVLKQTLQRNSINITQFQDCFELGCGVGRITLKLAEIFPKVIAADVSAPHLELARSALMTSLPQNVVEFRKLESIKSLDLLPNFDVFYSVIVLQHNPPPLIGVLLKKILSKLRDGGIAYFQVPTYALGYQFDCKTYLRERIDHTRMEMHVFPQSELFELIREQGCRVVEVREDNYVGNRNMISNTVLVIK